MNYISEDFEEPILVKLPRNGDELGLRFLRGHDVTKAEQLAKAFTRRYKKPFREAEYVYRMCLHTVSVNGTKFENITDAYEYFNKLDGRDAASFWSALDKFDIGMDTTIYYECPFCGNKWEEGLII